MIALTLQDLAEIRMGLNERRDALKDLIEKVALDTSEDFDSLQGIIGLHRTREEKAKQFADYISESLRDLEATYARISAAQDLLSPDDPYSGL